MIEKQIEDFSIEQIAKSGQCFRIHKEKDGSFSNVAFGKHLRIIQKMSRYSLTVLKLSLKKSGNLILI